MKKLFTILLFAVSFSSLAQDEIYTGFFSNKALSGYDTVAYFVEGKPVKGNADFVTEYKEATWYFSSQENLDKFLQAPEKYAPQYGGYCAWAIAAKNDFASGDPEQWTIVDGKLYINYNQEIKERWEKDKANFIVQGDKNWPKLIN